jgi:hypothetical protein
LIPKISNGDKYWMKDSVKHNLDNSNKNFEDRLKDSVGDWGSRIDKSIQELLYGYYPNLTEKQFVICDMIVSAIWDIGQPFYNAIVSTIAEKYKELFHGRGEVETAIQQLVEKGIVESKIHFIWFGFRIECNKSSCKKGFLRPVRLLDLKNDIEYEAYMIISHQFATSADEFLGPV